MHASAQTIALPSSAGTRDQIKSRRRVRDLAEVYTHEREVHAMLDLIPDMFPGTLAAVDIKFLEPACGSGNFLVEILRRKLVPVGFSAIQDIEQYEQWLIRALASIYAVDVCAGNVVEAKSRLRQALEWHYANDGGAQPTLAFTRAVEEVLRTNVLHADMLQDAGTAEVVDYRPEDAGAFTREWSWLTEPVAAKTSLTLFDRAIEPKRDAVSVHYSKLVDFPGPTRAEDVAACERKGVR